MYLKLLMLKLTLLMSIGTTFGMKANAQEAPENLFCKSASAAAVGCWPSFFNFFYENNQFSFTKELGMPSGGRCGWPPFGTQVLAKGRIEFYNSQEAHIYTSTDKGELEIGRVVIEGRRVELSLYDEEQIVFENCHSY
ncbi:hypothetical protein [Halobacteriovorax sp. DA5]|uniref:hypothetical protein n=1 Tax=Halobacteriovorax sp. DA5 TaxID=2067553 RepID=UPI0011AFB1A7|nr:hypothetical protein [Halobacteriovorax sp. DA5]